MPLVKHILFPIDFSERCRETVPYVAGMAKSFGAKITLLHVVAEPYWYAPTAEAPPVAVDVEEIRRSTERDLSQGFAEECRWSDRRAFGGNSVIQRRSPPSSRRITTSIW